MSVITKIRNRAGLMVAIIGLAIVSFLLMDVFSGNGIFAGDQTNNAGSIDGDEVSLQFFEQRVEEAVENYKTNTNQDKVDDNTLGMLRDQVWNELVREKIMTRAYKSLGLAVSEDELFDMVQGTNINPSVRQAFTNPQTGEFDRNQVVQFIRNLDQQPEDMQRRWLNFEKFLVAEREGQKYSALINKGLYVPKFFAARYQEHTNTLANGRFVLLDYAVLADSTIEVSEQELKAYYNENKKNYESKEEMRSVDYVQYDVRPSADDDARALRSVTELREQFATTENDSLFVSLNSDLPYDDNFVAESALVSDVQKQFFAANTQGVVSDVYRDGDYYKMTKMVARSSRPDSVKARHILIRQKEGESAEAVKKRADSLFALAKSGDFGALAKANSEDPGSAEKGGDLGFFAEGTMVKPFNDACFGGKKGDMVLVKTDFGWHIIQVTDMKGSRLVAKFATVASQIEASTETYREVYAQAGKFASQTPDGSVFEKNIEEMGLVKRSAEFIRVNDRTLQGLPNSREIVRWAYKNEKGAVSPVFEVEDRYIVATVVKITEKGIKPFEEVKEEVEALVKRDKKAEQLIAKADKALKAAKGNLDVFAQQAEGMVQVYTGATFQSNFLTGIGREPIINGTLFALGKGKLSKPLKGERGVYVVVVDELTAAPKDADLNPSKQALSNQLAARGSNEAFNAKKEMIEVNDNRHLFY